MWGNINHFLASHSSKTITCRICGRSGHNSRTCERSRSSPSTKSVSTTTKTVCCGICGGSGHNSRTCEIRWTNMPSPVPGLTRGLYSKPEPGRIGSYKVATSEDMLKGRYPINWKIKRGSGPSLGVTCGICGGGGHNKRTCEREGTSAQKLGPAWMNKEAQARFLEGPTKEDGPGHIYMYKISTPTGENDESVFKIGYSKNLPARRIHDQENANKEKYDIVLSLETPFRKMTENVIHRQLKSCHRPRKTGAGKTEWFTGEMESLSDTIKKVVREVKVHVENSQLTEE